MDAIAEIVGIAEAAAVGCWEAEEEPFLLERGVAVLAKALVLLMPMLLLLLSVATELVVAALLLTAALGWCRWRTRGRWWSA